MAVEDTDTEKKMKYPKSVFFIVSNEFCERFCFYGMRTALSLYFVDILLYSQTTATVMYHTFTMFAYFFPLIGAIMADSWLGKYKTILYLSIVYAIGQLLLSFSAAPPFNFPVREMSIFGLLLIAFGTGGIKPCVSAFGGDQFKLPEQEAFLSTFFSLFYFAINSGSLLSTFITPILRKDVTCFGNDSCYSLAFFIPAILMVLSVVIFVSGKKLYKIKEPEGNMVAKVTRCISHAIVRKIKSKEKREHWLDYADDRYDRVMIEDIKSVMKVLKLFIPIPIFWALYDQQGSRWTFQAARMDGEVFSYFIKPDQFQVINPLFILIFIPIFQWCIYPIIEKFFFINTPLRKLTVGGLLAALSFVISGILELKLEATYEVRPSPGLAQIRLFNTINCNATININERVFVLEGLEMYENLTIPATNTVPLPFKATYKDCPFTTENYQIDAVLSAKEETALSWAITKDGLKGPVKEDIKKSKSGDPMIRTVIYLDDTAPKKELLKLDSNLDHYNFSLSQSLEFTNFTKVNRNSYVISFADKVLDDDMFLKFGGVYAITGYISNQIQVIKKVAVVEPNSIHMFWLIPQYVVITMGEIMFSITGLEFAFSQAPVSMKSILQATWLLTVAIGNLIVVLIAEAQFFDRQVFEFFLFAGLMVIDIAVFAIMATFYKYVELPNSNTSSTEDINMKEKIGKVNESYSEDF